MSKRVVLLMVVSAVVGAALVPPVVDAATQLVTIKGAGNNNKARVTGGGRLRMDTEASSSQGLLNTLAFAIPAGGMFPFATGTASTAVPADVAILTHITVDLPSENGPTTVTLSDDFGLVWKGTVEDGSRHLDAAFETGSIWGPGGLQVDVAGTGAEWVISGVPLQVGGNPSNRREAAKAAMRALRQQR